MGMSEWNIENVKHWLGKSYKYFVVLLKSNLGVKHVFDICRIHFYTIGRLE